MAKTSIKDRILESYGATTDLQDLSYHRLAEMVFPPDKYPRAWRYATKGGPPGCYMALTRAINAMGGKKYWRDGSGWCVWIPRNAA